MVEVGIDGAPAFLVIDVASTVSYLTEPLVGRLRLERTAVAPALLRGVGGLSRRLAAIASHLQLGALVRDDQRFEVIDGVPTGDDTRIDGVIGLDILRLYDLDLDGPDRQMALYAAASCDAPPNWPIAATRLPTDFPFQPSRIRSIPVTLDGHPLSAEVSTGTAESEVGAEVAAETGLKTWQYGDPVVLMTGIGAEHPFATIHRFTSLAVAGAVTPTPTLVVGPVRSNVDMIYGADFLHLRRLWMPADSRSIWLGPIMPEAPAAR